MVKPLQPDGQAIYGTVAEFGLPTFPCDRTDKRPLTSSGFYAASSSLEQIEEWLRRYPNANWGFVPGSLGMVVIDVDGPLGEQLARAIGVYDVPTLRVPTRRGVHFYFQKPSSAHIPNIARSEFDVRGDAGYVIIPPSIHASGHRYEWIGGTLDDVAECPSTLAAWIASAARKDKAQLPPDQPGPRLLTALDQLSKARVVKYCDRVGYGLSDGRKTSAYRIAAFLRCDVGLASDLAFSVLEQWNAQNAPPLPADLLLETFHNAEKYAHGSAA